jgi:hypothetical protein
VRVKAKAPILRARTFDPSKETDSEMDVQQEQELQHQLEEQQQSHKPHSVDRSFFRPEVKWEKDAFISKTFVSDPVVGAGETGSADGSVDPTRISALSMNRILKRSSELTPYSELFDPRIYGSLNLFPVFDYRGGEPFHVFGKYQGLIDDLVMFFDSTDRIESLILLTRDEAINPFEEWVRDTKSPSSLLFKMGYGPHVCSSHHKTRCVNLPLHSHQIESLFHQPADFLHLLVQIKVLRGEVNFNEAELAALIQWVGEEPDRVELFRQLEKKILEYKDTTQEKYRGSSLHEVLEGHGIVPRTFW